VALISSLLLLMIITILALSLFRSLGTQEKIAGNLREKERALHAAESAQQYAEWWLLLPASVAVGASACPAGTLSANLGQGQICNQNQAPQPGGVPWDVTNVLAAAPYGWANGIQVTYLPPGMSVPGVNGGNNDPPYAATPGFFIADAGVAADGQGEAYQIDAYGYGGSAATVAVVESTYEVQQGVVNRGGL
jgi:type IV pilus assembly protein PilX